jgi:class 3 adenylate cyclase/CHASE2 domain-containing sensor protein
MKSSLKKYLWLTLLILLSLGLGTFTYKNPGLKGLEENALDIFFKLRLAPREDKIPGVALVMIDGKSFGTTYGYYDPLPRRYIAQLVDSIAARGASVIGLDIAFLEAQTVLDPAGDTLLAASMLRAGNVAAVSAFDVGDSGAIKVSEPHPFFISALKAVGYANLDVSSSGIYAMVRSYKPFVRDQTGRLIPSFSIVIFCLSRGLDVARFLSSQEDGTSVARIPLDDGSLHINFAGPPPVWKRSPDGAWTQEKEGRIPAFRSSTVTEGTMLNPDALRGRVVLVGNLSEFAVDQFLTPYYGAVSDYEPMRGVEVHANAFLTIAQGAYIRKVSDAWAVAIFGLLALAAAFASWRLHAFQTILFIVFLLLGVWVAGFWCFAQHSLWLPVASMTLTLIAANASVTIFSALTERKERKRITGIFGQYVDERVVRQLIENPGMSKLGGAHREVTVLFTDLNDFTRMSEMLGPDKTVKLMNSYLTEMSDIIQKRGGTIDKFIGDSIMAFWGAPVPSEEAPLQAAAAALQMQKRLEEVRHRWKETWGVEIRHRIGINSGVCTVGNIGSERKTNYTAMGDVVNLSSRIQDVNKRYGTTILMSEYTASQVAGRFLVREIESVAVDGRKAPVTVYELRDVRGKSIPTALSSFFEFYNQGLTAYKKKDWDEAAAFFQHALTFQPDDSVCQFFLEKISLLKVRSGDAPPLMS